MKKKATNLCKEVTLEETIQDRADLMSDEQLSLLEKKISDERLRRKNLKIVEENSKIEEQHSILLERVDSLLNFATEHSGGCNLTKDREDHVNNLSFDPWNRDPYDSQYEKDSQYIQDYSYVFYAKCTRCALLALKETRYNASFVADIKILFKEVKPLNSGL